VLLRATIDFIGTEFRKNDLISTIFYIKNCKKICRIIKGKIKIYF
jgi:hypothetical protein